MNIALYANMFVPTIAHVKADVIALRRKRSWILENDKRKTDPRTLYPLGNTSFLAEERG